MYRYELVLNFRENSAHSGTLFAGKAIVTIKFNAMGMINKLRMRYLYRGEWREKYATLESIYKSIHEGRYQNRVEAVRGLRTIIAAGGMVSGELAAEELPEIWPSQGEKGQYTGLVLLEFRVNEGFEVLERLRQRVNLWPQTLLSFVSADGQSLMVVIPYRLTGGEMAVDEQQAKLFHAYAYKRAADFAYGSTGRKVKEVKHDGNESFRVSFDNPAYRDGPTHGTPDGDVSQAGEPACGSNARHRNAARLYASRDGYHEVQLYLSRIGIQRGDGEGGVRHASGQRVL